MNVETLNRRRGELESFFKRRILPRALMANIRSTRHLRQWWRMPMNYVRLMEAPLAYELLALRSSLRVLDIGSPKLLPLYIMAQNRYECTISDVNDYFLDDFIAFKSVFRSTACLSVFDATEIPYSAGTFDRVLSISVLEHIPDGGDEDALREIGRVLSDDGLAVITLPVAPIHMEEWHRNPRFYWIDASRFVGDQVFYQRRYDPRSLAALIKAANLVVDARIYVAERPMYAPQTTVDGVYQHNFHYLQNTAAARLANTLSSRLKLPLLPYYVQRYYSGRYHYLTQDPADQNVRQVVLRLRCRA